MPWARNGAMTSSVFNAALISRDSAATISGGVPAGASRPNQTLVSKPGRPASAMVGTSGVIAARLDCATASATSSPDCTCRSAPGIGHAPHPAARHGVEQLAREMRRGGGPGRAEQDLLGLLPRERDQ